MSVLILNGDIERCSTFCRTSHRIMNWILLDYISKVDAVNVSTIHKVKGLEYPVVFVVDLVNQRFPGKKDI